MNPETQNLLETTAKSFYRRYRKRGFDYDEFYNECYLCYAKIASKINYDDPGWKGYLKTCLNNHIQTHINKNTTILSASDKLLKLSRKINKLANENKSIEEICQILNIDSFRYFLVINIYKKANKWSESKSYGNKKLLDIPLSEEEKNICKLLYNGATIKTIAENVNFSYEKTRKKINYIYNKYVEYLNEKD